MTGDERAIPAIDLAAARGARDRRALTSTGAAVGARALTVGLSLITVPLAIGYLGVEAYGVFAALTALTTLFVFADLGIGNGLLNVTSEALARDDRRSVMRASASAFFMLLIVAVALAVLVAVAAPLIDWSALLGVEPGAASADAQVAALVFIGLFLAALPFGAAERIRLAYQEGWVNSIAAVAGAVLALVGLLVAIRLKFDLPMFVLAVGVGPLVAVIGNALVLVVRQRPWLAPRPRLAEGATALQLARVGFLFLCLQLAVAVSFQSDIIVAAAVLGPEASATYSVTMRLALLVPSLVGLYLLNLWPAYTEAIARGDDAWVARTLRRSIAAAAALSGLASVGLVTVGGWFIGVWTGGAVQPPFALLVGAALWAVVSSSMSAIGILMNAASVIRFQVVVASVMAVASILLSIALARAVGIAGIVFGTLIAYVVFSAIPTLIYLPRLLRRIAPPTELAHG